jgi:hypothetical protein
MTHTPTARLLAPLLGALALAAGSAHADSVANSSLSAHTQECGACHMAYQPGLLPAASWQRLLANLPKHFGADASVDAATLATLKPWFEANAGSFKKVARNPVAPPDDRITRSAWFEREHREVTANVWKRPAIHSPANCSACHAGADKGNFSEHNVRIPQ